MDVEQTFERSRVFTFAIETGVHFINSQRDVFTNIASAGTSSARKVRESPLRSVAVMLTRRIVSMVTLITLGPCISGGNIAEEKIKMHSKGCW